MGSKKSNPEPYERANRNGERATVIQFHKDGGAISVLPDDRPRSLGSVVWSVAECTFSPPLSRCPLCDQGHTIFSCEKGQ